MGTLLAFAATAVTVGPAFAQGATDPAAARTAARTAALATSNSLRTMRKFQDAIDVLKPYEADNNYDVIIAIGQATSGFTTPLDRLAAVEYFNKAIALQPNNKIGYTQRAGAYGDAGFRWFEKRLNDRLKAVELSEAASPLKLATAGEYADLAGGYDAYTVVRGGTYNPEVRDQVMALRSKAIGVEETYARLLDRAELVNSRFSNPSAGRVDVDRSGALLDPMNPTLPATWYAIASWARRVAALPTTMTLAGVNITVSGITTPYRASVAQLRNKSIEYYSKYIDAFEGSGRNYVTYGDGIGAYENRAVVYRALGGTYHRKAIKDQETLIEINPRQPNYWRNLALSLDALAERTPAKAFYQKYLDLNGPEDLGENGSAKARIANG